MNGAGDAQNQRGGATMPKHYFFLYHHEIAKEEAEAVAARIDERFGCTVSPHIFKKQKTGFDEGDTVFVMADDEGLAVWLKRNASAGIRIVLLPFKKNKLARQAYGIAPDLDAALEQAGSESPYEMEHLPQCNGSVFFGRVVVGYPEWFRGNGVTAFLKALFKGMLSLTLHPIRIETAKEQKISTAMLLIDAGSEMRMTQQHPRLFQSQDNQCRRIAMLVYAPQSILSLLRLLAFSTKRRDADAGLPAGMGTLKSEAITLHTADGKLNVTMNGRTVEADTVDLQCTAMRSRIVTGFEECASADDKESLRVQNLPVEEEAVTHLSGKNLPLVPVASESAFEELFTVLRDGAELRHWYVALLLISTLMAVTGLFQNSSPTVIGAMILSPLMAPVVALATGLIRFDRGLIVASSRTIAVSVLLALAASALFAYAAPLTHMTEQMSSRMHPNLLDLAVAILSGVAAAYGYANARIAKSLAGVAVAVALVPPLSVAGIGIGWGSWAMFYGAFLLFLANIAGIVSAAGVTFFLLGFSSWRYAKTAFVLKLFMLSAVAFPLFLSTRNLIEKQDFYTRFDSVKVLSSGKTAATLELEKVSVSEGKITARIIITVPHDIDEESKQRLVRLVQKRLGTDARLRFLFEYLYE
jgi:uncharacterized hydrophobic protein (TIGR00271 family)